MKLKLKQLTLRLSLLVAATTAGWASPPNSGCNLVLMGHSPEMPYYYHVRKVWETLPTLPHNRHSFSYTNYEFVMAPTNPQYGNLGLIVVGTNTTIYHVVTTGPMHLNVEADAPEWTWEVDTNETVLPGLEDMDYDHGHWEWDWPSSTAHGWYSQSLPPVFTNTNPNAVGLDIHATAPTPLYDCYAFKAAPAYYIDVVFTNRTAFALTAIHQKWVFTNSDWRFVGSYGSGRQWNSMGGENSFGVIGARLYCECDFREPLWTITNGMSLWDSPSARTLNFGRPKLAPFPPYWPAIIDPTNNPATWTTFGWIGQPGYLYALQYTYNLSPLAATNGWWTNGWATEGSYRTSETNTLFLHNETNTVTDGTNLWGRQAKFFRVLELDYNSNSWDAIDAILSATNEPGGAVWLTNSLVDNWGTNAWYTNAPTPNGAQMAFGEDAQPTQMALNYSALLQVQNPSARQATLIGVYESIFNGTPRVLYPPRHLWDLEDELGLPRTE